MCVVVLQTLLQTTFAFGMAYGLALLLLPYFNGMIGGSLRIADFMNGSIIWIGATIVITTTVLAGLYPAIYISSFKPISALRSDRNVKGWNARVRQGLVVLQFSISIILIISTLIISKQIKMYHKMDLGYVYDEVLYVSFYNQEQSKKADYLKQELLRNGNISSISLSTSLPSNIRMNGVGLEWEGKDPNLNPLVSF